MDFKVIWTEMALADLEAIITYIAETDSGAAEKLGNAILGHIEILRIFYDAAKVFVFPSLYEGFGLPPLEAMAHGTPVLTSNTSSIPEVVGAAAVLVNPENLFEMMRALQRMLLDQQLREKLRQAGYEQVKKFSWERSVAAVLASYCDVAVR